MKRCNKCKAVISWDLVDVLRGEKEIPKRVDKESIKQGLCSDCYTLNR